MGINIGIKTSGHSGIKFLKKLKPCFKTPIIKIETHKLIDKNKIKIK
jgi:hypothetical protein